MGKMLHNDDFENFLENQANKHRMYPSDHVWINIQQQIHGYKRWPALSAIALFVIAALVVGTLLVKPMQPRVLVSANNANLPQVIKERAIDNKKSSEALTEHLSVTHITQQTIEAASAKIESDNLFATISSLRNDDKTLAGNEIIPSTAIKQSEKVIEQKTVSTTKDEQANIITAANNTNNKYRTKPLFPLLPFDNFLRAGNVSEKSMYEMQMHDLTINAPQENASHSGSHSVKIDKSLLSKLEFQFYFTPSVSYRRLEDDVQGKLSQSYITAIPYAANYAVDVNQVVHHKPAQGYEVGFTLGYKLTDRFSIRSGFQFNMRQYDIDAYMYRNETAPIALAPVGAIPNTINTFTNFRNVPTSEPFELKNRYYEISMPIGLDWRPVGKGKISWGIAASIQPTYTFDKQPFIITSNYKNYADGSLLMKNWNVNANAETYISYKTGSFRWQAGPQFRYQLMPTLSTKYPIKEYLLDYGFKVGFVKDLK